MAHHPQSTKEEVSASPSVPAQVQGTLLILILGLGWSWMGLTRKWERLHRERLRDAAKKHDSIPVEDSNGSESGKDTPQHSSICIFL